MAFQQSLKEYQTETHAHMLSGITAGLVSNDHNISCPCPEPESTQTESFFNVLTRRSQAKQDSES